MNSKGHLICSLVKSLLRIVACVLFVLLTESHGTQLASYVFAGLFAFAEMLGIAEELLDMR